MSDPPTELLLERMFRVRRVVLQSGAALLGLMVAGVLADHLPFWTYRIDSLLRAPLWSLFWILLTGILTGSLIIWHYIFRIGLREASLKYAAGHLAVCILLGVLGPVIVPLLIRDDIERGKRQEVANSLARNPVGHSLDSRE